MADGDLHVEDVPAAVADIVSGERPRKGAGSTETRSQAQLGESAR